ncbi:AI-2E family transporter [Mucilaginibacter sp. KACC 22773]|jgi:predicted PurR-regulated permease PerM|uniref:AI-2E family transporter n=1 Tax=Mucilaginibacter sp. KACC 22773 TaxID=3025671 RepID=UPI002366F219|nr:AI-2E family transporter [Mucilaginibacter sp. KACC 22773]WDF75731.1 AI-2E family transporter [Mucilaginibacter sp. KACC 22773]
MVKVMPESVKRAIELIGLFVLGTIVVVGNTIIMPLLMAFFFSLVLLPVFRFFKKIRVPEVVAVFLPILLLTIVVVLIIWLFSSQLGALLDDFPQIQRTVAKHLDDLSIWISRSFGYSPAEQVKFINEQSKKLFSSLGGVLSGAAGSLSGIIIFIGLLPIYIYFIILYRNLFLKFLLMWFKKDEYQNVEEIVRQTEKMIKSYLVGLLIQITYIIVLLGGTLWLFGIRNALLIGIIFAFLNLIPYLGALIGNILSVLLTLASSESLLDVLIVLGAITAVQFLDNNILMPRIVGSQVKINPLVSIVGIIVGGVMAGLSGMFLAMPVLSILKIMFDRTENYKQWGVLLGDERPVKSELQI